MPEICGAEYFIMLHGMPHVWKCAKKPGHKGPHGWET